MSTARTYGEACGIPRALDRVGERWALMVVRELVLGPKRFTDIRNGLPHASPNVLAQRLRELEDVGVVRKRKLPPPAASQVYELTEWGRELEDVLIALGRWGARAPAPPEGCGMSLDSHLLSLCTLFDPERAGDFEATIEMRFGEHVFNAAVAGGRIAIARGEASSPDAVVESEPGTFLAISHGRLGLESALEAGELSVTGDRDVVGRFVSLFTLPEPALV
jgi:DNA-binding HxlR family transcriptional regulator